jgi:alcohol dehydrogenase (cytochrome c)
VNARTGKVLWSQKLSSGIIGSPMTYTGPDGHQYVAVVAGVGGGAMVTKAMPGFPARGGTLYVFALDRNIQAVGQTPQQGTQSGQQDNAGTANKGKR